MKSTFNYCIWTKRQNTYFPLRTTYPEQRFRCRDFRIVFPVGKRKEKKGGGSTLLFGAPNSPIKPTG